MLLFSGFLHPKQIQCYVWLWVFFYNYCGIMDLLHVNQENLMYEPHQPLIFPLRQVDRSILICCSIHCLACLLSISYIHTLSQKEKFVFHVNSVVENLLELFTAGPASFFEDFCSNMTFALVWKSGVYLNMQFSWHPSRLLTTLQVSS